VRLLVTGRAGYIGSVVTSQLLRAGHAAGVAAPVGCEEARKGRHAVAVVGLSERGAWLALTPPWDPADL
jgi:nucleoside-diphosphate-sugar epimerase